MKGGLSRFGPAVQPTADTKLLLMGGSRGNLKENVLFSLTLPVERRRGRRCLSLGCDEIILLSQPDKSVWCYPWLCCPSAQGPCAISSPLFFAKTARSDRRPITPVPSGPPRHSLDVCIRPRPPGCRITRLTWRRARAEIAE
jgi:hypothetical protein